MVQRYTSGDCGLEKDDAGDLVGFDDYEKLLALLRSVEWVTDSKYPVGATYTCPSCGRDRDHGHQFKCALSAALDP